MNGVMSNIRGVEGVRTMNNGTLPEHTDKLSDDGRTVVFLLGCKCCWILHAHSYLTTEIALTSYLFLGKKEDKKGG